MLAKLLFRSDQKKRAMGICHDMIYDELHLDTSGLTIQEYDDLADAYYILGWIAIHAGDHTKACT